VTTRALDIVGMLDLAQWRHPEALAFSTLAALVCFGEEESLE
jgi:hypothetical protein